MDEIQWYEHKEGSYWLEKHRDWILCTYIKYDKKYPHLSGRKEVALFKDGKDAERFCKLKNKTPKEA